MLNFLTVLHSLVNGRIKRDDEGATAVEYGLMVGLIAIAIIVTVTALGLSLNDLFVRIETAIDNVTP